MSTTVDEIKNSILENLKKAVVNTDQNDKNTDLRSQPKITPHTSSNPKFLRKCYQQACRTMGGLVKNNRHNVLD